MPSKRKLKELVEKGLLEIDERVERSIVSFLPEVVLFALNEFALLCDLIDNGEMK